MTLGKDAEKMAYGDTEIHLNAYPCFLLREKTKVDP
jgi:hypothetical protein